jgi:hypothetical protein
VACDEAKSISSNAASVVPCTETSELLQRIESLVEPVSTRVTVCNEELHAAEAKVRAIASELAGAEAAMTKTMRGMQFLKTALSSESCKVCIGDRLYSRETIGKVLECKVVDYKNEAVRTKKLIGELAAQENVVREVAVKVARWIEKEAALVSQVEQLEKTQANLLASSRSATEASVSLATSVEAMLAPAASNVGNLQLLAEVDSILAGAR